MSKKHISIHFSMNIKPVRPVACADLYILARYAFEFDTPDLHDIYLHVYILNYSTLYILAAKLSNKFQLAV